jgi:hypothetical protein
MKAVSSCLMELALSGTDNPSYPVKMNQDKFLARIPVLKWFFDGSIDDQRILEMEILKAVTYVCHKNGHPPGNLFNNVMFFQSTY